MKGRAGRPGVRAGLYYTVAVAALWCSLGVGAFVSVDLEGRTGLPMVAMLLVGACVLLMLLAEGLAIVLLMRTARSTWERSERSWFMKRSAAIVLVVPVAAFLSSVLLGWMFVVAGMGFPDGTAVLTALADIDRFSNWMTSRDMIILLVFGGLGSIVTAALFQAAKPIHGREAALLALVLATVVGGLTALVSQTTTRLASRDRDRVTALLRSGLLPTSQLWGVWLLPARAYALPDDVELEERVTRSFGSSPVRQPNLLLVSVESLRGGEAERLVDGYPVMPTVSLLAAEGINFTRAYAPSNESAYSLTAILTSNHPLKGTGRDSFTAPTSSYVRIYDVLADDYAMGVFSAAPEDWLNMKTVSWSPTLTRFFDASTSTSGHIAVPASDTGFSAAVRRGVLKNGNLDDAVPTNAFKSWVAELTRTSPRKPFFALVKYESSHFPYQQGFNVPQRFAGTSLTEAESRSLTFFAYPPALADKMLGRYRNSLSYVDGLVANMVEHLRSLSMLDDTVIIVFGDHGQMFHENGSVTHAARLQEKTLHAGFVMWGAMPFAPRRYDAPVSLLDIGPIVLRLAGAGVFGGFQGVIPPGLEAGMGQGDAARPIFSVAQHVRFEESVLVDDWRYVRQSDGLYERLYNVRTDPFERVEQSAAHPGIADCLNLTLRRFRDTQLGYYARPDLVRRFFPPRHLLPRSPECAWGARVTSTPAE